MTKIALAALAVCSLAVGVATVRGVETTDLVAPCQAIDHETVQKVLGTEMRPGRPTGGRTGCQYRPVDGAGPTLMVNAEPAGTAVDLEEVTRAATRAGADVERLGASGFVASSKDGRSHSAEALRGQARYRVMLTNAPGGKPLAVALLALVGSSHG